MADSSLQLLFQLRAENKQAKEVIQDTRNAVSGLKTAFGSDLAVMERVAVSAFGSVQQNINQMVRNIPIVGAPIAAIAKELTKIGEESAKAAQTAATATAAATTVTEAATVATEASTVATTTQAAATVTQAAAKTELAVATGAATVAEEGLTVATTEIAVAGVAADVALSPLLVTIGAIAIGITAAAVVITAGAVAGFKLAESASEAGSKIHDLAQQTGLGTLTLSGFKLAADEAGKSVDTAAPAMNRFSRLIGEASDGSKEAIATLKRFGISAKEAAEDTDAAFAKAIKRIHEIPPGALQAAAAQKLFGRSGAELIPIIEQMNGNMAEAIQKAKDLGVAFTKDGADAADEFGDNLHELTTRVEGLKYSIGNALIPVFVELFRVVGAESKPSGGFSLFGALIAGITAKANELKSSLFLIIAALQTLPDLVSGGTDPFGQAGIAGKFIGNLARITSEAGTATPGAPSTPAALPSGSKSGADEAKKKAAEEYRIALKAAADAEKDAQISYQTNTRNNKEELDKQTIDLAKFTEDQKRYEEDLAKAAEARAVAETTAATEAFHKKVLTQAQYNEANQELLTRRRQNEETFNAAVQSLDGDRDKKQAQSAQLSRDRIYKSQVDADQRLLREIKRYADEGYILYEEAENRRQQVEKDAYERIKAKLEAEFNDQETDVERRKDITQQLTDLENDRKNAIVANARFIHEARQQDIDDLERINDEVEAARKKGDENREKERREKELRDPTSGRSLFGDEYADALDQGKGKLEAFAISAQSVFHDLSASAGNFGTMMYDVFQGIGQAVGNVVKNFVLFGSAGTSFRKFAAEVISGVAAIAATKAIFELAEGLAALARAFFGDPTAGPEASMHFAAAAQYGIVAGVAAIAGRAIAGNAFKDQGAASGAGGNGPAAGSTGTTGTSSSQTANTITQNRNQEPQHIFLHVQSNDSHIVRVIQQDVRNNGSTRDMIVSVAGG